MAGAILIETSGGGCTTIQLSNRDRLNAMTVRMWRELRACFERLAEDDDARCVVVRGAGDKAFSAGADISEFEATRATFDQVVQFHEEDVSGCLSAISACPVPVAAAIQGACFGGGLEIASCCDIRIAAENSRFGAPVGKLGFPLAFAETQALYRLVGAATVSELVLEGRIYSAQLAYQKGLITRIVRNDEFEASIQNLIGGILENGPAATRAHKQQIRRLMTDASPVSREERMKYYQFANTDEYREGVRAFLSKAGCSKEPVRP